MQCPVANRNTKVSFIKGTIFNVVISGLRDQEMQERCLSGACMKTISTVAKQVQFCGADEAGRHKGTVTVGGISSSYQCGEK